MLELGAYQEKQDMCNNMELLEVTTGFQTVRFICNPLKGEICLFSKKKNKKLQHAIHLPAFRVSRQKGMEKPEEGRLHPEVDVCIHPSAEAAHTDRWGLRNLEGKGTFGTYGKKGLIHPCWVH